MVQNSICTSGSPPMPHIIQPAFKVDKKDGVSSRFILDCRKTNDIWDTPPPMGLPSIDAILYIASRWRYHATLDATSFFFQIPLARSIQGMFGCRLACKRGRFWRHFLARLPMGFSWAPALAQAIANAACRMAESTRTGTQHKFAILAWVDNFIILAESVSALRHAQFALLQALQWFNIAHKGWETGDILGLTFSRKGIKQGERYITSASAVLNNALNQEKLSDLSIMKIGGCLIWAGLTTLRCPLSAYPHTLRALQIAAKGTRVISVTEQLRLEWTRWLVRFQTNAVFNFPPCAVPRPSTLWTDASLSRSAYVHHKGKFSNN